MSGFVLVTSYGLFIGFPWILNRSLVLFNFISTVFNNQRRLFQVVVRNKALQWCCDLKGNPEREILFC